MSNTAKNFDILTTGLSVLHNYFVRYVRRRLQTRACTRENEHAYQKTNSCLKIL